MKSINIILIYSFTLFFGFNLFAQTDTVKWIEVSPFSYETPISGKFISASEGWIRNRNEIWHTEDGAKSFQLTYSLQDTNEYFMFLQMTDKKNGYAAKRLKTNQKAEYKDTFLKTKDGGKTWVDITDTTLMGSLYKPIQVYYRSYFIDSLTGFCFGSDTTNNDDGAIYKTKDGGVSWNMSELETINGHKGYYVNRAFFLDEMNGWGACIFGADAGITIYTKDGGDSWKIGYTDGPYFNGIHFIDTLKGGVVGSSWSTHVKLTEDNFKTLSYKYSYWINNYPQTPMDIHYQNDSTIWVTGYPGYIFRSTNSGQTFQLYQDFAQYDYGFHTIQFLGNTGYIFGNKTLIKFDGDRTNIEEDHSKSIKPLIFPNPANNELTINLKDFYSLNCTINIYNIQGRTVYNSSVKTAIDKQYINTSTYPNGIYFITITTNKTQYQQKLIINH